MGIVKVVKPHAEQLHAHNWSFFEFLIQEKQILFFPFMVDLVQPGDPILGLAKSIIYFL